MKISIGRKIMAGFSVILILMIVVSISFSSSLAKIEQANDELVMLLRKMEKIDHLFFYTIEGLKANDFFIAGGMDHKGHFELLYVSINEAIENMDSDYLDEEERVFLSKLKKAIETVKKKSDEIAIAVKSAEKGFLDAKVNKLVEETDIAALIAVENVEALHDRINIDIQIVVEEVEKMTRFGNQMASGIAVASILFGLIMAVVLTENIARPVQLLARTARKMSEGDLSVKTEPVSLDEIGELAATFNKMSKNLQIATISRDYIDNIFSSMTDMLVVVGPDSRIKTVNTAMTNFSGYSESELIGKPIADIFFECSQHKENGSYFFDEKGFKKLIDEGMVHDVEICCATKIGLMRPALLSCAVIRDKKEDLVGVVVIAKNIAERKRAEYDLLEKQKELEISEKDLERLSRGILSIREEEKKKLSRDLHDVVGTMSVAISSGLNVAEKDIKNKNMERALKGLIHTREQLQYFVKTLKDTAIELRPQDLDVLGLVSVLRTYFSRIEKWGHLKIDFNTTIDKRILTEDASITLYRITQEAFSNIMKHAMAKNVVVRLYSEENKVKFSIADDGQGFSKHKSEEDKESLNIGVIGMDERIKALGGSFLLKSKPGKGTTISITIPIKTGV